MSPTFFDNVQAVRKITRGLTAVGKSILLELAWHADPNGRNAYPSIDRLAAQIDRDRSTVFRHLKVLEADGWIVIDERRGRGNTNLYELNLEQIRRAAAAEGKGGTVPPFTVRKSGRARPEKVARRLGKGGIVRPEKVAPCREKGGTVPPDLPSTYPVVPTQDLPGELSLPRAVAVATSTVRSRAREERGHVAPDRGGSEELKPRAENARATAPLSPTRYAVTPDPDRGARGAAPPISHTQEKNQKPAKLHCGVRDRIDAHQRRKKKVNA